MDPSDPASFTHRTEALPNGRVYHFVDERPDPSERKSRPTMILLHGFPDFWYGWRYQIKPWVEKGFRVIVPDMLGYGGTAKPSDAKDYTPGSICKDLASLLDVAGVERAIVIGHDWGAFMAWQFCLWFPKRVEALVTACVAYMPRRTEYLSLDQVVERTPHYGYQAYFAREDSTQEIEQQLPLFFDIMYRSGRAWKKDMTGRGGLENLIKTGEGKIGKGDLLDDTERAYYLETFKKGGMHGALNYYRTTQYRYEEATHAELPTTFPPSIPVLFFYPKRDPTVTATQVDAMKRLIPMLEVETIEGSGHWVLVEEKDLVTQKVTEWLQGAVGDRQSKL